MDSFKLYHILSKAKAKSKDKDKVKLKTNTLTLDILLKDNLITPTFTSNSDDYYYYEITPDGFWKKIHLEHWLATTTISLVALGFSIFALLT